MKLINQTILDTKQLRIDLYTVSKIAKINLRDVLVRVTAKNSQNRLGTCRCFRNGWKLILRIKGKKYTVRAYIILYYKGEYLRMFKTFAHELYHLDSAENRNKRFHEELKAQKFAELISAELNDKEIK